MITKLWLQRWWWETEQQLSWTSLSVIPTRIKQYMCILCHSYVLCLYVSSSCQFLLIHEYVNRWLWYHWFYTDGESKNGKRELKLPRKSSLLTLYWAKISKKHNLIYILYFTIFQFPHACKHELWMKWMSVEWINVLMNKWISKLL